jgi:glycine/D-amino acid oxidase-like deaminating enzyme
MLQSPLMSSLDGARPRPFWPDTTAPCDAAPTLNSSLRCDLAVVGGGFTGLWTALLSRQRWPTANIVLLEAGLCGAGASGRNGGFCAPSISHGVSNALKRWPQDAARLIRLGRENLDELAADLQRFSMQVEFEREGKLNLASQPWQVDGLRAMQRNYARFGIDCEWLEGPALRQRISSPLYSAALFEPNYALVNPSKLVSELRRLCIKEGIQLYEKSPVESLQKFQNRLLLKTPLGDVEADRIALATNIAPPLLKHLSSSVIPVYDYALVTEPLTQPQLESICWTGRHGITDSGNQFHYLRKTRDNRILWGGYDAIYHYGSRRDEALTQRPASFARLAEQFQAAFPPLRNVRFSHAWGGIIDTSARTTFFTGSEEQGRIAYALGFTGQGVSASRFAARSMIDLLAGERTERTELAMTSNKPFRFPVEPLRYLGVRLVQRSLAREDRNGQRDFILKACDALGIGFDS